MAFFVPNAIPKLASLISRKNNSSFLNIGRAAQLNQSISVEHRNTHSHLDSDDALLLNGLLGLERHTYMYGYITDTSEGWLLSLYVLLLGKRRFECLVRALDGRPLDCSPVCPEQHRRILELF